MRIPAPRTRRPGLTSYIPILLCYTLLSCLVIYLHIHNDHNHQICATLRGLCPGEPKTCIVRLIPPDLRVLTYLRTYVCIRQVLQFIQLLGIVYLSQVFYTVIRIRTIYIYIEPELYALCSNQLLNCSKTSTNTKQQTLPYT